MMTDHRSGDGPAPAWFTGGRGTNAGPECVAAASAPTRVRVRGAKHVPCPHLTFTSAQWSAFLPHVAGRR